MNITPLQSLPCHSILSLPTSFYEPILHFNFSLCKKTTIHRRTYQANIELNTFSELAENQIEYHLKGTECYSLYAFHFIVNNTNGVFKT